MSNTNQVKSINKYDEKTTKSLVIISRYLSHAAAPLGALSNTRMRTRARIACPQYWYAPRPRPRSARAASASTSFDRLPENEWGVPGGVAGALRVGAAHREDVGVAVDVAVVVGVQQRAALGQGCNWSRQGPGSNTLNSRLT